jgi:hypothetical protein
MGIAPIQCLAIRLRIFLEGGSSIALLLHEEQPQKGAWCGRREMKEKAFLVLGVSLTTLIALARILGLIEIQLFIYTHPSYLGLDFL